MRLTGSLQSWVRPKQDVKLNSNGFKRKFSGCLPIFMPLRKCYPSGLIASALFRKLQWTWTLCQWPLAPPPLFCFKKMGSATFLGVILSNWATPWTEQTCRGECSRRSRKPMLPRGYSYRHNEALTRWGCVGRGTLWWAPWETPCRCRSLNRWTHARTLAVFPEQTMPNFIWSVWFHPVHLATAPDLTKRSKDSNR